MHRWVVTVVTSLALPGLIPVTTSAQTLDCLIFPEVIVAVAPPVEGVIDRVLVDRGDLVTAGQVLATLESSVERVALRAAQARAERTSGLRSGEVRVDFGERRYARTLKLFRQEIASLKEMDEAETAKILAEYELLQAREEQRLAMIDVDRAHAALELRTIRSPVTGVVVERLLAPGEFAKQAPVVRVAKIHPLRVEVIAPLTVLGQIRRGTEAYILPEAPVGGTWRALVTVVDRVVDAASGTFGVRLALPNPDYHLPAGLKCLAKFNGAANGR